jgi:hypothetical protein
LFLFFLYNILGAIDIKQHQNTRLAEFLPTQVISNEENILFYEIVGQEVNLNDGITVEVIPLLQPMSEPAQPANHFDFVVYNNTTESIKFQDQGVMISGGSNMFAMHFALAEEVSTPLLPGDGFISYTVAYISANKFLSNITEPIMQNYIFQIFL